MMKSVIKPTLVLTLIAAIVAGLLAFTYNVAGIAELGTGIGADKLAEISPIALPGSTKLIPFKASIEDHYFLDAYKDEGGAGTAIFLSADGYGGKETMKLLVGFNVDNTIAGCYVLENAETPGLGTKALDPAYLSQFVGKTKDNIVVSKTGGDIDAIAGATKSSVYVGEAFAKAYEFYEIVMGGIE